MLYKETEIEEVAPWLVIFVTLFAGFLRLYQLERNGLLLDETVILWMAQHSVADMLQWIYKIGQHPPLYYLLLHSWIGLNGHTPYDIRQLSALFGAGTIPVIYLIGKRLSGAVTGLAAAVFLSLSLFNIHLARETGLYTFLAFNAAVAIYALVRLLTDSRAVSPIGSQFREYLHAWRSGPLERNPQEGFSYQDETRNLTGWRAWIFNHRWSPIQSIATDLSWAAYILFSAATLLSHNTAVFFFFSTNIFVLALMLFQRIKKSGPLPAFQAPAFGNWGKAQLAIFLLWSPWLLGFIQQVSRLDQAYWIPRPGWDSVIETFQALVNSSAPGQVNQIMTWSLCGVLCVGLVYYRKKFSIFLFLAALFTIPILGELIVSMRQPIFLDRTLIWITIPLFLLLAAGITQLKSHLLILLVLGIFGTHNLFAITDRYKIAQREDWGDPAGYIVTRAEKDDLILFNSAMAQIPFEYYFIPNEKKNYLEIEKHGVPDMFKNGVAELRMKESDIAWLVALLSGHHRVWLVYSDAAYTDPLGLIPQTLARQMQLIKTRDFFGGQIQLYATP